jgi:hypothetical protein
VSGIRRATELRRIKGMLVDTLREEMGYKVDCTDTPHITVFTDMPVNKTSQKISRGYDLPYITSFGPAGAEKFISENSSYRLQ